MKIVVIVCKSMRIPKGQSKMDNPEKLTTYRVHKTKKKKQKQNTICVGHHCTQASTNNVNKT